MPLEFSIYFSFSIQSPLLFLTGAAAPVVGAAAKAGRLRWRASSATAWRHSAKRANATAADHGATGGTPSSHSTCKGRGAQTYEKNRQQMVILLEKGEKAEGRQRTVSQIETERKEGQTSRRDMHTEKVNRTEQNRTKESMGVV